MIRIVQSSKPRTGSTLLVNLIHGFLCPQEAINYSNHNIKNKLVTKTHDTNIKKIENEFPNEIYKLFFIMSERNNNLSEIRKYNKKNVLIINYDKLLETNDNSMEDIIEYTFNEFNNFIPKELKPDKDDESIKDDMKKRMKLVNDTVELMKHKPFSQFDTFTHIHGSHRDRGRK